MRNGLCQALIGEYSRSRFLFLTGDLGFMALEPLHEAMGDDFINAGIAEQNMVSVAAGLSFSGLQTWVYSIAPFVYARPFEQIRNDICLQNLDVKIVGNGGGYGYGYMGATHHAIEDYGVMATLQNMTCFIPAFAGDMAPVVQKMAETPGPAYLRLGRHELPDNAIIPPYGPWRELLEGERGVIVACGPLVSEAYGAVSLLEKAQRPSIWVVSELPLPAVLPERLLEQLTRKDRFLLVVEEHVAHGGIGMALSFKLAIEQIRPRYYHSGAIGYPADSGYGSQQFHRRISRLDRDSIRSFLLEQA